MVRRTENGHKMCKNWDEKKKNDIRKILKKSKHSSESESESKSGKMKDLHKKETDMGS